MLSEALYMPENTTAGASGETAGGAGQAEQSGNNTSEASAGAGTETATTTSQAAQTDITQSAEFKAALTKAIEKKLPQLRKQLAREISGESDGQPNAEELQRTLESLKTENRNLKARDAVRSHLLDGRHKVGARTDSLSAIETLVLGRLEYDDDGQVTNLKDAVAAVKAEAPALFQGNQGSVNGGSGNVPANTVDMNSLLRRAAGRE